MEGGSPVWLTVAVSSIEVESPVGLQTGGRRRVSLGREFSLEVGEACGVKAWPEVDGRRPTTIELAEEDNSAGVSVAWLQ
jgi:hypothetical protein